MSRERADAPPPRSAPRPWTLGWLLHLVFSLVAFALIGFIAAIAIEWTGMHFWWLEEGVRHSERMLATELGYLSDDFRASVVATNPVIFAERSARWLHRVSGLQAAQTVLAAPPGPDENLILKSMRPWLQSLWVYIEAAANIAQVYGVRLAVVILSLPAFLLFGAAALVDGLVQRDLRRFGGGTESAFVYHHLKKLVTPLLVLPIVVYLAWPVSIHPNGVFLPAVALFALVVAKLASRFKKYL